MAFGIYIYIKFFISLASNSKFHCIQSVQCFPYQAPVMGMLVKNVIKMHSLK